MGFSHPRPLTREYHEPKTASITNNIYMDNHNNKSKEAVQQAWMKALEHKKQAREHFEQWLREHGINKPAVTL